jgi:hypothetical protein
VRRLRRDAVVIAARRRGHGCPADQPELARTLKRVAATRETDVSTVAALAIAEFFRPGADTSEVERVRERLAAAGIVAPDDRA